MRADRTLGSAAAARRPKWLVMCFEARERWLEQLLLAPTRALPDTRVIVAAPEREVDGCHSGPYVTTHPGPSQRCVRRPSAAHRG